MTPEAPCTIVAAETLGGGRVVDRDGNEVGAIDDLVIDFPRGTISYAVMVRARDARVVVPWNALCRDEERGCFVLEAEEPA